MNEVIIDGCNVAECEFFSRKQKTYAATKYISTVKNVCLLRNTVSFCVSRGCYFKQLKRLQAENKQLKQCIEDIMELNNIHNSITDRIQAKIEESIL